jgi:phosphatidylglycerol:prolipoprotein diacylglycerol transferase
MGVAFHIGSIAIQWYGIILVIGILAAIFLARSEAKRRGDNSDHIITALLFMVPLEFIGACAHHVIDQWSYYSRNPRRFCGASPHSPSSHNWSLWLINAYLNRRGFQ